MGSVDGTGSLEGKVAFISGAARGQGRAHAVRMAEEGADIIGFDICDQLQTVLYDMARGEDLEETARLVEATGRQMVFGQADVRDASAVQEIFEQGLGQLGRIDIVVANAGIFSGLGDAGRSPQAWHDAIDVLLTGVYHTCEAAIPSLIEQGAGGAIIITSSTAGLGGLYRDRQAASAGIVGYAAAKHGVVGLMRVYATSLGAHRIRANTIHPTGVDTPMVNNDQFRNFFQEYPAAFVGQNLLPIPWVEPVDIANAAVFLASDAGRYITGVTLPVDAGFSTS
jgi:SDR family mycofactocin-dependent oxidoreductase